MTKFKFGDKVLKGDYLHVIVGISTCDKKACIAWIGDCLEPYWIDICELTKVSDWIPCSERMPEFNVRVLVVSGNRFSYDFLLDMGTHSEWASLESWDYWMYAPEMPEVKE